MEGRPPSFKYSLKKVLGNRIFIKKQKNIFVFSLAKVWLPTLYVKIVMKRLIVKNV